MSRKEVVVVDGTDSGTEASWRRGSKPQPRKKALISMTAAEYDEFCAWADADGMTKAMLMHDMMGRERERRVALGR